MRKLSAVVLVGAVIVPLSLAQAATEVLQLRGNITTVSATSVDPATEISTTVFVARENGSRGPIDRIFYMIFRPEGTSTIGFGALPQGAFQVSAHSASLDVDVNAIGLVQEGDIPENGVITVDWAPNDVFRFSGSTKSQVDNVLLLLTGTGVTMPSDIVGEVFGVPLDAPFGEVTILRNGIIAITKQ
jgi:hypothetical protein